MRTILRYLPLIVFVLSCDSSSSDKEATPVAAELQPVSPPVLSTPEPPPVATPEPTPPPPVANPDPTPTLPPPPAVEPAPTFAAVFTTVLKPKCLRCHSSAFPAGDISLETREGVLATKDLVSCGQAEDSLLYQVVAKDEMPFGGPALGADEKKMLALWIDGNCL